MSASETPLKVVLCWHMHQPDYRDRLSGEYQQPWTYLHAIKDYVDMAAHIEAVPQAKAVVNFAPILLEQIDDYAQQINAFLTQDQPLRDPLLAMLVDPVLPEEPHSRVQLIQHCLRANRERLIDRHPAFMRLADIAAFVGDDPIRASYLETQYFSDILVWYHLAWVGEFVRASDERIKQLLKKEHGYSVRDRRLLMQVIGEILSEIIPQYRRLQDSGQVELAMSPYAHPILPLMLDLHSARQAMPDAELPEAESYPGGEARCHWHLQQGLAVFERYFGRRPVGCWPSEGAVSEATLRLLERFDFQWTATGQSVLANSLEVNEDTEGSWAHRPYALQESQLRCFFRDDGLSDLVGFTYATWHGDDAVGNLVEHLERIAVTESRPKDGVVSIILDGENAWEYYPRNARFFLSALYQRLAEHSSIELTTFSACCESDEPPRQLDKLIAGSWVYGTFSTWIGSAEKNRAWDMLVAAKQAVDAQAVIAEQDPDRWQRIEQQLAVCEGSDWCWWFGDYNSADSVSDFEQLYRRHLANLYGMLRVEPPEYLAHSFVHGSGAPEQGGTMRRGQTI